MDKRASLLLCVCIMLGMLPLRVCGIEESVTERTVCLEVAAEKSVETAEIEQSDSNVDRLAFEMVDNANSILERSHYETDQKLIHRGRCGDSLYFEYYEDGVLVVFGSGEMWDCDLRWVESQAAPRYIPDMKWGVFAMPRDTWDISYQGFIEGTYPDLVDKNWQAMHTVIVEEGVTSIGRRAFQYCGELDSVKLPATIESIGKYAFYHTRVNNFIIPDTATMADIYSLEVSLKFTKGTKTIAIGPKAASWYTEYVYVDNLFYYGTEEQWKKYVNTNGWSRINASNVYYESVYNPKAVYQYDASTKTLTYSGSGNIPSYNLFLDTMDSKRPVIEHIVIEEGITGIGTHAFRNCKALKTVSLPSTVSEIGKYAFDGCTALKSVSFKGSFEQWLLNVNVSDNNSPLQKARFNYNSSHAHDYLETVVPPTCTTSGYTINTCYCGDKYMSDEVPAIGHDYVKGVCSVCGAIDENYSHTHDYSKTVVPPTCTTKGYTIYACSCGDKYLGDEVPLAAHNFVDGVCSVCNWSHAHDYSKTVVPPTCTTKGYTIYACSCGDKYMSDEVPAIEHDYVKGVCSVCGAIDENYSHTHDYSKTVVPPTCTTKGYTIYACSCGDKYHGDEVPLAAHNFVDGVCSVCGLKNKNFTGTCGDDVTWLLEDGVLTISGTGNMSGGRLFKEESVAEQVKKIVIENGITSIGWSAFCDCINLTSVHIPNSVTEIQSTVFAGCNSLTSITIPAGVTEIWPNALNGCGALRQINVDKGNSVFSQNQGVLFNKTQTKLIRVPQGYTGSYTIPYGVRDIEEGALFRCENLTAVVIPDSVTGIGKGAFSGCRSLSNIVISNNTTSLGDGVFEECEGLEKITIPGSVGTIGKWAFYNCSRLTNVVIMDGVESISSDAFQGCSALKNLTIPSSVSLIDFRAFGGSSLTEINFSGNAPEIKDNAFSGLSATVYYPKGNASWNDVITFNYGGTITWKTKEGCKHLEKIIAGKEATCTTAGLTEGKVCSLCGEILVVQEAIPAKGHNYRDAKCSLCGAKNPDYATSDINVKRVYGSSRYGTCVAVANELKATLGIEKFTSVVVASGGDFPDALAGTYLAAVKSAPILLIADTHMSMIVEYIDKNMIDNGTIYILGSENSVSKKAETALSAVGNVKRLGGKSRFITNLKILEETKTTTGELLIVYSVVPWDALSVSSSGCPILLVNGNLRDDQKQYLETTSFDKITIIGSTASVPKSMETELSEYCTNIHRVYGKNRYMTSIEVAKYFYGMDSGEITVTCGTNFPDGLCSGALAYIKKAPVILTDTGREALVADYVKEYNTCSGYIVGSKGVVSDETVRSIFNMKESDIIQ